MVLVCGGIGAGKSVVTRLAACEGFPVYDCDTRARALMEKNPLREKLTGIAGEGIFRGGNLDRPCLARMIFADAALRRRVNETVHTAVRADIAEELYRRDFLSGAQMLFVETAIPSTSGLYAMADLICLVEAPEETRVCRVLRRNPSLSEADICRRIDAQNAEDNALPEKKIFRIDNSGYAPLLEQFRKLKEKLNTLYHA